MPLEIQQIGLTIFFIGKKNKVNITTSNGGSHMLSAILFEIKSSMEKYAEKTSVSAYWNKKLQMGKDPKGLIMAIPILSYPLEIWQN